jgi:hypothetical protein
MWVATETWSYDHIAFASARLENVEVPMGARTKRQPTDLKSQPMMARRARKPVAGADNGHRCGLLRGVASGGIPPLAAIAIGNGIWHIKWHDTQD